MSCPRIQERSDRAWVELETFQPIAVGRLRALLADDDLDGALAYLQGAVTPAYDYARSLGALQHALRAAQRQRDGAR